jgi:hypothetical protein
MWRPTRDSKIWIYIRILISVHVLFIYNRWRKNTTFKKGLKNDRRYGPEWNAYNFWRAYLSVWSKRSVQFGCFNSRKIFLILYVKTGSHILYVGQCWTEPPFLGFRYEPVFFPWSVDGQMLSDYTKGHTIQSAITPVNEHFLSGDCTVTV